MKTLAQNQISIEQIRNANATKANLDLCEAENGLLYKEVSMLKDSVKTKEVKYNLMSIIYEGKRRKEVRRKKFWRSVAIGTTVGLIIQRFKNQK